MGYLKDLAIIQMDFGIFTMVPMWVLVHPMHEQTLCQKQYYNPNKVQS
jgi:hypothetical protein